MCGPEAELDTLDGRPNLVDAIRAGQTALSKNPSRVTAATWAVSSRGGHLRSLDALLP